MLKLSGLIIPSAISSWLFIAYILLGISLIALAFFWIWALIHAARTPRASWGQRFIWAICLLINPLTTIWYWCIWKRWAFWTLFAPLFGFFVALPLVTRSMMTKADASTVTNALFALGSNRLVIFFAVLLIYTIVLRLAVVLHLSKNAELTAMDRNDWVLTMAFPFIGFGTALTYTSKYMKPWALATLAWLIGIAIAGKFVFSNLTPIILPVGEEKRVEFRQLMHLKPS
jgi:hypothetical protein